MKICLGVVWTLPNIQGYPIDLAPVVQTLDSVTHRIKIYPVHNANGFPDTYPLDSNLSEG